MYTDYNGEAIIEWLFFWLYSCRVVQSVLVDSLISIEKSMMMEFFIRIGKFINFICDLNFLGLVLVSQYIVFCKGHLEVKCFLVICFDL